MVNGFVLKKWQIVIIENLISNGHKLDIIIQNSEKEIFKKSKYAKYLGKNSLYNLYLKFFHNPDMLSNVDFSQTLNQYDVIEVVAELKGKFSQYFATDKIEIIKAKNLDFILRFGFNIIKGEILNSAKYGVWSFHHGDEREFRGGPPGFWEIYYHKNINGIILQKLTEKLDGGMIIRKGMFSIVNHSYSTHLNELLRHGINLILFAVENLSHNGELKMTIAEIETSKIYKFPGNFEMFRFLTILIFNRIKFNLQDLFLHENWNIGIAQQKVDDFVQNEKLEEIHFIPESENSFFAADVFISETDEVVSLFYEDFDYKSFKGKISSRDFQKVNNSFTESETILEKPYHLAFPFLWVQNGKQYLVPEANHSNSLRRFKIDSQSKTILDENIIMKSDCIDSVVFKYNDLYWIFCTKKAYGTNDYLFAYYADDFFGDWSSYKNNPIVSDSRKARMAGNIFMANGKLYRPGQKNNVFYGEAIVFNEIIELTKDAYVEKEIFKLMPSQFLKFSKGIHTFSVSKNYIAIDAKNYKFVRSEFLRKIKLKIRK